MSILALGRVFVANMTGNVVFAAFALVGAPGFSLSASLFALAGFLVGAYARRAADRPGRPTGGCTCAPRAAEALLAAAALLVAALSGDPGASHGTLHLGRPAPSAPWSPTRSPAMLAVALGIQNAVARKLAVPDMTTTVLTMTLTGLGADLRAVRHGTGPGAAGRTAARAALGRRLLAVGAMVAGGAAGAALALRVSPLSALALATALLAVAAVGATMASSGATRRGGASGTARGARFPRARADLLLRGFPVRGFLVGFFPSRPRPRRRSR